MTEDKSVGIFQDDSGEIFASVSLDDFLTIEEDSRFLEALHEAGVDNWEHYDDVLTAFKNKDSDEPFLPINFH